MSTYIGKIKWLLLALIVFTSCTNEDGILVSENQDVPEEEKNEVSIWEAQADLESLLLDIDAQSSRSQSRNIKNSFSLPVKNRLSRSGDSVSSLVHIFNFEDNQGYAIMSGDKRVPSLIAITESGNLTEDEEIDNPGIALFLEGMENLYEDRVQPQKVQPILPDSMAVDDLVAYRDYGNWKNIVYKRYGFCPVKWGQGSPYNKYCPLKNGKGTVTGCVATAVAQLMAIYRYPESYNVYSFSWDAMTEYPYGNYCSSVGQDNIARLMQQLGLSNNLNVSYDNENSGAKPENIVRTLQAFGYSQPGTLKDYNLRDVVQEIINGYGVLIGGCCYKKVTKILGIKIKTEYSGGHRWLAHGLLERRRTVEHYNKSGVLLNTTSESEWYIMCNWGWNGNQDGYYLGGAFDASKGCVFPDGVASSRSDDDFSYEGTKDNYQYQLTAITGIRK